MKKLLPSLLAILLCGVRADAAAPTDAGQAESTDDASAPPRDDFLQRLAGSADALRDRARENPDALPQAAAGRNFPAEGACVDALKQAGLGMPAHYVMACVGVRDAAQAAAVAACYAKMSGGGADPKYLAPSCKGVRDAGGVEAVASCQAALGGLGEEAGWRASACQGVRDGAGAEAVAACHAKLKADGADPKFYASACGGVSDPAGVEAVAACMKKMGEMGEDPMGRAEACRGTRDAAGVAAVAACHSQLKSEGEDPRLLAAACSGVRDAEGAAAVAACHRQLGAQGEPAVSSVGACGGVRGADDVEAVAACAARRRAGEGAPGAGAAACRGARKPAAAATEAASGLPASPAKIRLVYAADCGRLPAWLKDVPDSFSELGAGPVANDGEFEGTGDIFVVAARPPKPEEKIVARDAGRRTATPRVARTLKSGFQIPIGGKTRTLRRCPAS